MAGYHPFLTKLRAIVQTLDDEALAALANKGLLRRAQKDLETSPPTIASTSDGVVQLQAADATVTVPELPAKSQCTCPATGICRHILAALLFLRDDAELAALDQPVQGELFSADAGQCRVRDAPAEPGVVSPAAVLADVTDEQLQQWAGKALLKKAAKALAAMPQVEIDSGPALVVRFPTRNITCRWIPSGGLLGMVCSCQSETVCEHVVAAVLAYQASLGKRQVVAEQALLEESAGAPRTRAEVLESVCRVLRDLVGLGLARLSSATAQRLTTLAVSAHGVDLPRLERMLAGLAQEIELTLRRDAQASTTSLLVQAARIEALRTALVRRPLPALVGQHRTSYHEVGQLTLHGLGAQRWRSKGGYHGLTLFFWDESAKDWATWSAARPIDQAGFDPVASFRSEGPWAGCNSPEQASRSVVRLTGAFRNAQGRLSGRAATRALVTGPTVASSRAEGLLPFVKQWPELADRARRLFGGGLSLATANQELVLLAPHGWGPPQYDSLRQELTRPLLDSSGRLLDLWLPFTPENESAVEWLEQHDPADTWGLLGTLRLVAGRVCVQPISLFAAESIVHLNLDKAQPAATTAEAKSAEKETPEEVLLADEDEQPLAYAGPASALARLLVTAQAELEALAENGVSARREVELLAGIAKRLDALGLATCAHPLARLKDQLASSAKLADPEHHHVVAGTLLAAYYILRLAGDQEAVAAATASLG
jgi:hypothetical protein